MKKTFLVLSLVTLGVTVASANVSVTSDQPAVVFAAYEVRADRFTAAEKAVEASLSALRADATRIQPLPTELPSFGTTASQPLRSGPERQVAAKPAQSAPARS